MSARTNQVRTLLSDRHPPAASSSPKEHSFPSSRSRRGYEQDLDFSVHDHTPSSSVRKETSAPSENSRRQVDGDPIVKSGPGSSAPTWTDSGALRSEMTSDSIWLTTAPHIILAISPMTPATWAGSKTISSSHPMKFSVRVLATRSETTSPNRPGGAP